MNRPPTTTSSRHAAGFTLVELLVAALVGLLVLAGVHRIFVAGLTTQHTTAAQTQVNRTAQVAIDDMISRLRGGSQILDAQPNMIWFLDQDDYNVRYWLDESELLRYRSLDPGSYSAGVPLATDISQLTFEYYDQYDQPAVIIEDVTRVVVELTAQHAAHSARFRSAAALRNK